MFFFAREFFRLTPQPCLRKPQSSPAPLSTTLTYMCSQTLSTVFRTVQQGPTL